MTDKTNNHLYFLTMVQLEYDNFKVLNTFVYIVTQISILKITIARDYYKKTCGSLIWKSGVYAHVMVICVIVDNLEHDLLLSFGVYNEVISSKSNFKTCVNILNVDKTQRSREDISFGSGEIMWHLSKI